MGIKNRNFGCELEFTNCDNYQDAIRALRGAGLNCMDWMGYHHRDSRSEWKIVSDASVRGGYECVSPILNGEEGLEQVQKACDALQSIGCTVNRSTGLHVHVDAFGLSAKDIANVVLRYSKFENEIDGWMPVSRRADNNSFCYSMRRYVERNESRIACASDVHDIRRCLGGRFMKVNVEAYTSHGTLEFRQHSGSLNGSKVCNWIKFCVNFVEESKVAAPAPRRTSRTRGGARISKTVRKMMDIAAILSDNEYHSAERIARSLGGRTKASSVVVMISNMRTQYGFEIKKDRRFGYIMRAEGDFGVETPASVSPAAVVPAADDSVFKGLDPEVVSFYQERASELAA